MKLSWSNLPQLLIVMKSKIYKWLFQRGWGWFTPPAWCSFPCRTSLLWSLRAQPTPQEACVVLSRARLPTEILPCPPSLWLLQRPQRRLRLVRLEATAQAHLSARNSVRLCILKVVSVVPARLSASPEVAEVVLCIQWLQLWKHSSWG